MDKYDTAAVVNSALTAKPLEFKAGFDYLMAGKISDAIQNERAEVAQAVYNRAEEVPEAEEQAEAPAEEETNEE